MCPFPNQGARLLGGLRYPSELDREPCDRRPGSSWTVRLNRTAHCHKKPYVQYQWIERSFDLTSDGCQ